MVATEEQEKFPARIILTRGLLARLDLAASRQTLSRSALVRRACELLLRDEPNESEVQAA